MTTMFATVRHFAASLQIGRNVENVVDRMMDMEIPLELLNGLNFVYLLEQFKEHPEHREQVQRLISRLQDLGATSQKPIERRERTPFYSNPALSRKRVRSVDSGCPTAKKIKMDKKCEYEQMVKEKYPRCYVYGKPKGISWEVHFYNLERSQMKVLSPISVDSGNVTDSSSSSDSSGSDSDSDCR